MSRRQTPIALRNRHLPPSTAGGPRPLLLALAMAAGFAAGAARAQPTGAQAIHGSAALSQQGSTLLVTTQNGAGSNHSAINWQSFSVPAGTTTHFAQPGATSTSINRVIGPDPSAIFGTLSSNGRLVLVNPAGIAVGAGAVVDTAGFTASTLRMSDADAIAGRLRFGDGSAAGPLRVDGQVLARSGDVVLIGSDVQAGSQAVIQSPEGATVLAAGQKVELTGRGLEGIRFEVQAPSDQAVNLGTLRGDAVGVFAGTLRHSGLVQAQAVSVEGGRVVLRATDHAEAAGTTQAQGLAGAGGRIDVLGRTVGVMAGAVIDTSHTAGGGQIRIGGDYKGGNAEVPNAQVTWVAADAQLRANATDRGDGGKVIVWADDTTRAHGRIEAKGGANGGDGGFVETSGKRHLDVEGARVDASAAAGQAGRWLLDPSTITITAGPSDGNLTGSPQAPNFESADGGSSVLSVATLNAAIDGNTSVTVSTASAGSDPGDIVFDTSSGELRIAKSTSGTTDLRLEADGQIRFTGTQYQTHFVVEDANDAGTLNVHLLANASSGPQVLTDSGAQVQFSTLGFSGNGNRLNVVLPTGKTWQNDGTVTLNLNSMLRMGGATFDNIGTVQGAGGPYGGVGGYDSLGTFNNVGSVWLNEGQFRVADLANSGYMDLTGNTDLAVARSFTSTGSLYFDANAFSITQQSGDLDLGSAWISAASVNLAAQNGSVNFDYLTTSPGESGRPAAGNVTIQARDNVTGNGIDASGISWGEVGPGAGGNISVTAGGKVTLGTIYANGGDDYEGAAGTKAGDAGTVQISAGAAGIELNGGIDAYGGYSYGSADGGRGGAISLVSPGSIHVYGSLSASGGGSDFGRGGNGSAGGVTVSAGQDLSVWGVDVSGGYSNQGPRGGDASSASLSFAGSLDLGSVWAGGGSGGQVQSATGGAGGRGGTISITRTQGDLELGDLYLDVSGGWGGGGTIGGAGGDGGTLNLTASNGGVRTTAYDYLSASGGWGGQADPSTTNSGGRGGRGGSINITAKGASELLGQLDAGGGMGGDGDYYGSSRGGTGGDGGAIRIDVSGPLTLAGALYAGGGWGGEAGGYDEVSYSWLSDPSRAGAQGASGSVSTRASGGIVVPDVLPPMETESPMFVSPAPTSSPSPTPPPPALYVDGSWVNESALQLSEGATLAASGPVTNNGSITLAQGSTFVVGHAYDPSTDTYDFGSGTLTNAAGGLLAGSGTLQGHLVNAGTVAPGGEGTIGALTVTGDFTQQATGTLLADIAANTTYLPGVTYDQLVVHGAANLGGQLMVSGVPAVATPEASQLAATEPLSTGSLPAPTPWYELLSAASSSGQFSLVSGPPELVSQIRMNIGGMVVPVPGFTALPSPGSPLVGTGLLAAIQEMLPGVSLEQIQQVLTESQNNAIGQRRRDEDRLEGRGDIVVTDTACQPG